MLHIGMLKTLVAVIPTLSSQRYLLSVYPVVYNHWTGMVEWNGVLEWWNGVKGQCTVYLCIILIIPGPRVQEVMIHDNQGNSAC